MNGQSSNLAFVFPGQGSQSIGMLDNLAADFSEVQDIFKRASDALGKDLWALVHQGPADELNQTHNTQPAMLAAGVAVWTVWCKLSPVRPAWMAGHSLGEYTALVCSGAIAFEEAIKLVAQRGKLMQEAVPAGEGAMAAILGLEDHQVISLCNDAAENQIVSAVNFNSLGQVVIAGNTEAVERAIVIAKALGAKRALQLPVSVPSHCALMKPAADKLSATLKDIAVAAPQAKLIHNVDVTSHEAPDEIRQALAEQLYMPVRWVDSVQHLHAQGVTRIVECGPGKVLIGLNKRIVKDAEHYSIYDTETINNVLEHIHD